MGGRLVHRAIVAFETAGHSRLGRGFPARAEADWADRQAKQQEHRGGAPSQDPHLNRMTRRTVGVNWEGAASCETIL